jgi:hypothetical protein
MDINKLAQKLTKLEEFSYELHDRIITLENNKSVNEEINLITIDWSKIPVDTKVLVRDNTYSEWERAYFSHFSIFYNEPLVFIDGKSSYTSKHREEKACRYIKLAERKSL